MPANARIAPQSDVALELIESEKKFRAIFESAVDGIIIADHQGRIHMLNRKAEELSGYDRVELIGKQIEMLVPPDQRALHERYRESHAANHRARVMGGQSNIRLLRKNGSELDVDISLSPFDTIKGMRISATIRDISERRQVESELHRLNRTLEVRSQCNQALIRAGDESDLLQNICSKLVEVGGYRMALVCHVEHDPQKTLRLAAHAGAVGDYLERLNVSWADNEFGRGPGGTSIRERRPVACRRLLSDPGFKPWRKAAQDNGYASSISLPLCDGETVFGCMFIYAAVEDAFDTTEVQLLEELAADVSYGVIALRREDARRKAQSQLDYQADYDQLTGLANRRLLSKLLEQVIALSQRAQRNLAVLIIDIDRFAAINESLGHVAGDILLSDTGRRIAGSIRDGDTVARLDGDRFAVIATNLACSEDADLVVRKVMGTFAEPFLFDGREIGLTGSIGIAVYPIGGATADLLLKNAAAALNRAKQQGPNTFRFYTEDLNAGALARLELEAALRQAIDRGELVLHYQPKVDLQTGRVSGAEALLRWQRPGQGLVPPMDFIPFAEKTGLIVGIGAWVIDTACAQIRAWLDAGFSDIQVAVNLSANQFRTGDLKSVVEAALMRHDVPAQRLELELTESTLMENPEDAVVQLRDLKRIGVRLSLDDFGTGYSSLSYLSRFPVDIVKIDRSFVTDIVSEPRAASIANSIIALAHRMHLKVVAEGVENEAQLGYLRQNRCDEIQGYYFSRPLAADAFTVLLSEGRSLAAETVEPEGGGLQQTLLLVDGHADTLAAHTRLLQREGYRVLGARDESEGFAQLARNVVHVIITGPHMNELHSTEFLRKIKELHPDTVRMALTAESGLAPTIKRAVNDGALHKILAAPCEDEHLRDQIRDAFRYYDAVIRPRTLLD